MVNYLQDTVRVHPLFSTVTTYLTTNAIFRNPLAIFSPATRIQESTENSSYPLKATSSEA